MLEQEQQENLILSLKFGQIEYGCQLSEVAYVGNDVNDIPAMEEVGISIAVADAHPSVLVRADMILSRRGGEGALRETCERILEGRGEPSHV